MNAGYNIKKKDGKPIEKKSWCDKNSKSKTISRSETGELDGSDVWSDILLTEKKMLGKLNGSKNQSGNGFQNKLDRTKNNDNLEETKSGTYFGSSGKAVGKNSDDQNDNISDDEIEVRNLARSILEDLGFQNPNLNGISSEPNEREDDEEEKELCDFCRPHGRPCCMKCLIGKGSKRIVNIRGNVHGFGN